MREFSQFVSRVSESSRVKLSIAWSTFLGLAVPMALAIAAGFNEEYAIPLLVVLVSLCQYVAFLVLRRSESGSDGKSFRKGGLRFISRRALQYSLARFSALIVILTPVLCLFGYVYINRHKPLSEFPLIFLVIAVFIGIAVLRYRTSILDAIDRRYFREQYDTKRVLALLMERVRGSRDLPALAELITREVDLALHLDRVTFLVLDPRIGVLSDLRGEVPVLDISSRLAMLVVEAEGPLEVNLRQDNIFGELPDEDLRWLKEGNFKLLVPLVSRDGSLIGMIALGEKKSGISFTREDRQLLAGIANSAAFAVELEQLYRTQSSSVGGEISSPSSSSYNNLLSLSEQTPEQAGECPNCGIVYPSKVVYCSRCSHRLELSMVPYVLPGRFRFEQRIGRGGMGVVYKAVDLSLGRMAAVKTLRKISPEDALRLRREARAAAAVSHPSLASVYGVETWQGSPLLILEYLDGGTLSDRLKQQNLSPLEAVDLGIAMASALSSLHAAGILHRDIKPSNIGYARSGTPKLMDLGISGLRFVRTEIPKMETDQDASEALDSTTVHDASRVFSGTLPYLSPEAAKGEVPSPSFDIWSLSLVIFEAITGRKVFSTPNRRTLLREIRGVRTPAFSQIFIGDLSMFAVFFQKVLHRDQSLRPGTAQELVELLMQLRDDLQGRKNMGREFSQSGP
jgi:tRNA A-37 threonylcarbamoyl transferase component Bud32